MAGKKLTYAQVVREVDRWYNSQSMVAMRTQAAANWRNVLLSEPSTLPDMLTVKAEVVGDLPAGTVLETLNTLVAEVDSFSEYTSIVPTGQSPTAKVKALADKVEQYATVLGQELSRSGNVKRRGIQNQAIGIADIRMLHCAPAPKPKDTKALDEPFVPWSVSQPDLGTCGFPMNREGGAFVPRVFVRKYACTLDDAQDTYGNYDGNGKYLTFKDGVPSYTVLEERPVEEPQSATTTGSRMVTVRELHYQGRVYHTVSGSSDSQATQGTMLFDADLLVGFDTAAVVIPGDDTASTVPGKEMIAAFESLLANQYAINYVRSFRMTLMHVIAQGGDIVVMTPQKLQTATELGIVKPGAGGPGRQLISVDGETVLPLQIVPNDELDKITIDLKEERTELLAAWRPVLDPNVIAAATATATDIATAGQARRKTTLLKNCDRGAAIILEMALNTVEHYDGSGDMGMYAADAIARKQGGQIAAGTGFSLSAGDLAFQYRVYVATRQETEIQKQSKTQTAIMYEQASIFDHDDVLATQFPDVTEQNKKLLTDAFLKHMDSSGQTVAAVGIIVRDVALLNGYILPPPAQMGPDGQPVAASAPGAAPGQPAGPPGIPGQQTFGGAVTEPASGGGTMAGVAA